MPTHAHDRDDALQYDQCEAWGDWRRCHRKAKHKGVKSGKMLCGAHAGGEKRSKDVDVTHERLWKERQAREKEQDILRQISCLGCNRPWTAKEGNPYG